MTHDTATGGHAACAAQGAVVHPACPQRGQMAASPATACVVIMTETGYAF